MHFFLIFFKKYLHLLFFYEIYKNIDINILKKVDMGFLFDTEAEYDDEIALVRTEMRNAIKSKEFRLNTSQSSQSVVMDPKSIRDYLTLLTTERRAFIERSVGANVTSIVYRRC